MNDIRTILRAMACVFVVMIVLVIVQLTVGSSFEVTYDSNGNVTAITCDKALPDECVTFLDIDGACPSEIRDAMWRLQDKAANY